MLQSGINITSVVQPESGAIMASRCPYCKHTVISLSPYAAKPKDGDLWIITFECNKHFFNSLPRIDLPTLPLRLNNRLADLSSFTFPR